MMIKQIRPDCATLLGRHIASEPLAFSRDLLAATVGDDFPGWFRDEISRRSGVPLSGLVDDGEEPRLPDEEFTEKSFRDAPKAEMRNMREIWRELTPRQASSSAVWTYINLRMIERGLVKPWYFVNSRRREDKQRPGNVLVEKTLQNGSEKEIKKLARSVSRFLTGYVPERSMRPLYANCPPARAWWMWHLAELAEQSGIVPDADAGQIFDVIRQQLAWGELTEKIVSRLTVIGDVNIRHGILRFFLLKESDSHERLGRSEGLRALLVRVGEMSAWRALGFFGPDRVADILKNEIVPSVPHVTGRDADEEDEDENGGEDAE